MEQPNFSGSSPANPYSVYIGFDIVVAYVLSGLRREGFLLRVSYISALSSFYLAETKCVAARNVKNKKNALAKVSNAKN